MLLVMYYFGRAGSHEGTTSVHSCGVSRRDDDGEEEEEKRGRSLGIGEGRF